METTSISRPLHISCSLCSTVGLTKNKRQSGESLEINCLAIGLNCISASLRIAAERFPCMNNKILGLSSKNYLPKITHLWTLREEKESLPDRDYLLRLCFLTTIKEGNDKLPITRSESRIFDESHVADVKTNAWLGWRAISCYALLATSSGALNFLGYAEIAHISERANMTETSNAADSVDSDNKIFTTSLICTAAAVVGLMTNWAGLWWTGRHPDVSSNKANKQQNRIHLLQREYWDLALELINLYKNKNNRPLAVALAKEIDLNTIAKLLDKSANDEDASQLVGLMDLQAAIEYVNSGGQHVPRSTALRAHINAISRK